MQAVDNINGLPPPAKFANTFSRMHLSLLFKVAAFNLFMVHAVRTELCQCVRSILAFYIKHDVEGYLNLVEQLHSVYIRFAVLDFVNGLPLHEEMKKSLLEIVMDNVTVNELVTYFADKNDPDILITFHSNSATVWETEAVCT